MAHDEAPDPVFWPTPGEDLTERTREKQRRSDSRDRGDRTRGDGGSGGGEKNCGGGDYHHRRGGGSGGGGEGGASGAGGGSGRHRGRKLWSQQPGQWLQHWRRQRGAEERRERTCSVGRLINLLPLVFGFEHGPRGGDRGSRQQVSRVMAGGASGPEAFTLLLRLLMNHFDRVGLGEGYTKLHTFGVCNCTPFLDFKREFRLLVSTVTGSGRVLSPRTDVVLEVVRMTVTQQFPTLMLTLYPGSKATDLRSYASLDAMWRAFSDLAPNKTPAANGAFFCIYLFLRREHGHPRRGSGPPIMSATRAKCRPSRFCGRRDRTIVQLSCPSMIHLALGLTRHRTAGH